MSFDDCDAITEWEIFKEFAKESLELDSPVPFGSPNDSSGCSSEEHLEPSSIQPPAENEPSVEPSSFLVNLDEVSETRQTAPSINRYTDTKAMPEGGQDSLKATQRVGRAALIDTFDSHTSAISNSVLSAALVPVNEEISTIGALPHTDTFHRQLQTVHNAGSNSGSFHRDNARPANTSFAAIAMWNNPQHIGLQNALEGYRFLGSRSTNLAPGHLQPPCDMEDTYKSDRRRSSGTVSGQSESKKRTRVDTKKRERGTNPYGRKGNLRCAQCRKRNWKCLYTHIWAVCEFCQSRGITEPCIKLPGPKAAARLAPARIIPTPVDSVIRSEDALLLQYAYCDETSSPRTRSFIRQFAITFGPSISSVALRHAVLAYAACLLPPSQFREASDRHAQKATRALIQKLETPSSLRDADVFAASMLMWILWIQNRAKDAVVHARGVITMLHHVSENTEEHSMSDMLKVFGPLAFGDARFFVAMGLGGSDLSPPTDRRTAFKDRVHYHHQIVHSGTSTIVWVSPTKLAVADCLWDAQRLLLSYLEDVVTGDTPEQSRRIADAAQYVLAELKDPDLRKALADVEIQGSRTQRRTVEDEVTAYFSRQLLTIQLSITMLTAPTLLEGLRSAKAVALAKEHLSRGRAHPIRHEGPAHEFYTWAYVIDLGLTGLAFTRDTPEGCSWVTEELKSRGKHKFAAALERFWEDPTFEAVKGVITRVVRQSSERFVCGGPVAKP